MNNFWNEPVDQVMSRNGTLASVIEKQKVTDIQPEALWQLHDSGHGYTGWFHKGCPICLRNRNAETANIVAQRNARLAGKVSV